MIERQIDSPMPMPLDLVVKKALNSRSAFSAEIPTPQSFTVTSTCRSSSGRDRITSSRGRSVTGCIASMPLITRLMITCCSWTRSARTTGRNGRELHPQRHLVAEQFTLHQAQRLINDVIDVERRLLSVGLFHERTDAPDHLTRPIAVPDDPLDERRARPGWEFRGRASAGRPRRWRGRRPAAGSLRARSRRSARPASSRA